MTAILESKETFTTIDENGNEKTTVKQTSKKIERNTEPDYIKLYTKMWCDFNNIPSQWQPLFFQLVIRMTYCNITDEEGGQLVSTSKPYGDDIARSLGWTTKTNETNTSLMKGLKALCKCGAIRKINRGVYQINPEYASKGEWKYNPKANRGGVEELIATFKMSEERMQSKVNIVWADDGKQNEINQIYRTGLNVNSKDSTILMQRRCETP